MNKQELIEKINELDELQLNQHYLTWLIGQLDVPETGHADEAPRYVKNILARLRGLPQHDREVWLKAIMGEFEKDFSSAKWREGYEQGKFEGVFIREKVTIPQFVGQYIARAKIENYHLFGAMSEVRSHKNKEIDDWLYTDDNMELFARAWLDGYTVVKEKRYIVKVKNTLERMGTLNASKRSNRFIFSNPEENNIYKTKFTRKELEDAGFGEVFNSPLFEVEEVD